MAIIKLDKTIVSDANQQQLFDPLYGGIYKGAFDEFYIEWEPEQDKYLKGYNVYYSLFPLLRYKANQQIITGNSFRFKLPIFPQNVIFYFWVSKIVGNKENMQDVEIFINEEGQTVYKLQERLFFEGQKSPIEPSYVFPEMDQKNIEDAMKDVLKRIQTDFKFMLQNGGIECYVYMRRWASDYPLGVPCKCTDTSDADADFRGRGRCSLCFGTGIVGGYYPPINILLRFNEKPSKKFDGAVYGLKVSQTYDAWTLPEPILRVGDLIVRKFDGNKYVVDEVQVSGAFRSILTRQDISMSILPETDIRRIVSLETINNALNQIKDPRYNEANRISF
jgi:hypothetical protein